MRSRFVPLVAVAALLVVGSAACGDDEPTPKAPADAVKVHAEDSLKFKPESYTAPAGDVTFDYINDGSQTHTLLVEGIDGFKLQIAGSGDSDVGTVKLEAGEYTIYCDISGHRAGGMEATLSVS